MTITTPNGQKINLKTSYCFALMARLFPKVDPYDVIKTAEAFGYLRDILILIVVSLLFITGTGFSVISLAVFIILLIEGIMEKMFWMGLLNNKIFDFFIYLAKLYRHIHMFHVSSLVFLSIAYYQHGWKGVIVSMAILTLTQFFVKILSSVFEPVIKSKINLLGIRKSGSFLARADKNFLNAYLFYALKFKRPRRLNVYVWELEMDYWRAAYNKLFFERPFVVKKLEEAIAV